MESIEVLCRQIEVLYQEYRTAPFPKVCLDTDEANHLVHLDSILAGCVSTFLGNGCTLDLWRTATLGLCYRRASLVLLEVPDEAKPYFARMEIMAGLVLQAVGWKAKAADNA